MLRNNFEFKWMKLPCYSGVCSGIGLIDDIFNFFNARNTEKMVTQVLEGLMSAAAYHFKENSTKNTMKQSEIFVVIDKH